MSRVNVKCISQKQSPLVDMATMGPKLLSETLKSVGDFIQQAVDASPQLPRPVALRPQQMCEIPETECPPRCVCHITWEASPREKLACNIKVTNSSEKPRVFALKAIPFPDPAGTIQITPDSMNLGPGQTGGAQAFYTVPDGLATGTYKTEILVAGAYEQCITVTLHVHDQQHCECHLVQGEIPVRIRAHRWYEHFQCVERCFKPAQQRKDEKKKRG